MKRSLTILPLLVFSFFAQAQKSRQISLDLNRSFHGSGDMRGLGFAVEYGKYVNQWIEFTGGLASNMHHDVFPLTLTSLGSPADASFRMVTAGLQVQGQANFAFLNTPSQELKLGAGPVVRYQSSSLPNVYGTTNVPNFPEPVFTFRHYEKQNRMTAGYLLALSYSYTFPKRLFLGLKASFQNDTNSDVITQYGLRIGKRF